MEKKWWQTKVAYQIYPKSFYDSNGDGIGDLQGIIRKLDYLRDLGVDILWLSPVYVSPLADQGYDIADYYDIDPRFGTMQDMDQLIAEAKKRGLHIIMDLVVNHCSDENIWFRKACEDPEGRYGKFFYLRTVKPGEPLPTNWRSYFGGPVWDRLPGHDDIYYLHVFHKKQPDLNWENPDLREEVYKMINWWLDKGISGFRIDAIINIKKALPMRSYPVDREDGLADIGQMLEEAEGIGEFLGEMRDRCFAPHDAFTVGEVFHEKPEDIPLFIGDGGYFSSMYDFAESVLGQSPRGWHRNDPITPDDYKHALFGTQKKIGNTGFISIILENHDQPRGVSYFLPEGVRTPAAKKMLATGYFFVRGLPWIYQGQELGMENTVIRSIEEVDDISTLDQYRVAIEDDVPAEEALRIVVRQSRDNARTPYQWTGGDNAGFMETAAPGARPWLPVNPNYRELNLEAEAADPDSVYNYYRQLIRLRKDPAYTDALIYGDLVPYLEETSNALCYLRKGESHTLLIMTNWQDAPQTLPLPGQVRKVLLNNMEDSDIRPCDGGALSIRLEGWQALVLELG